MVTRVSHKLDKLAVVFSAICLVHCLLLPVGITLLPIFGSTFLSHAQFHQLMLIVVLPTSFLAFGLGCREHRQGVVPMIGGLGVALLIWAAFAVESSLGHEYERAITITGGLVLAVAHVMNFRYCRHTRCAGHTHPTAE